MRVPARVLLSCWLLVLVGCRPTATLPERLELTPSTLSLQFGEAQTVEARARIGMKATNLDGLTWTSSDPALVSVTEMELGTASVQGLKAGTATVTAQLRDAIATVTVTVAPRVVVLERIDVTPVSPQLAKGLRLQLEATGVYNDGSTKDLTTSGAWASADSTRATVSADGLVSARGVGVVEVRAIKDGVTGRVSLTVTAASIVGIDVRPAQVSLARGTSQQFSATARLSDATTQDVTAQVTWSSSDAAVASVDGTGRLAANVIGTATLTATLGENAGAAMVTITTAALRTLEVVPAAVSLPLGSTQQLAVVGHFSDGSQQDLTPQATWRAGTPAVATVSTAGLVSAVGLGLSVIAVTVDGISANASITCSAARLQTIHVAPQGTSLALGLTRAFTATGLYTDGSTRDLTATLTWSSSDAGVASVSNAAGSIGLVRAMAEGAATMTATNGTLTGSSNLTITPAALVSLQVSPPTASVAKGLTQPLTARGTFSDASQRDVTALASWNSSALGVASVSSAVGTEGLLSALTLGTATVTASVGPVSGSMLVEVVAPVLQRIDVSAAATSLAKGRTQSLTATGVYSDGSTQDLTTSVTWAPASGAVLRVSSSGVLTTVALGTAGASARLGAIVGSTDFTVTAAELDSVTLTPASPALALGLSQALVARGTWSDGTTQVITTQVTWSAVDGTVATVSTQGLVSSVALGATDITATLGLITGSARITVTAPVVASLTVTPANPVLDKTQTQQLAAEGLLTDGSTAVLTGQVTWLSSAPSVVSVSTTGEVTGVGAGIATVSATLASVTGSTTVSVNRPTLVSLTVAPASGTINRGATLAFTALATYVDASTELVTGLVTWSSSEVALATLSAAGVATGVAAGTVTVTAQWGSISGTAALTVNALSLQSLVVTGSPTVATGAASPLVATATWSDASTSDVTGQATWASDAPATARLTNLDGVRGVVQGLAAGNASVTATVDSVSSAAFGVQVLDTNAPYGGRCGPGLVISQVYGGGGNAGATWRNDFVELHNPTASGLSLNGLSLQYTSSAGNSWGSNLLLLSNVTLPAGSYYLVQLASGGAVGALLPTPDQSDSINLSATAGKLALVSGTAALTGTCPTAGVLDFVGFGTGTNCSEGAPAPAGSASTWLTRGMSGCRDGNQNGADFTATSTVPPRNRTSTAVLCSCFVNGTAAAEELNACLLQSPASLGVVAGEVSPAVSALVTQPGVTDTAGFDANLRVQVGFGPSGVNPTSAGGWRWWPGVGRTAGTVSDAYDGVFVAPAAGGSGYTARASRDGVNWTACDLNGAGSGVGLAFEMGQLGLLTVP